MIEEAKTGVVARLLLLVNEARATLVDSNREISVVLRAGDRRFAIAVDGIESVERLEQGNITPTSDALNGVPQDVVSAVARRARDSALLMLVTPDVLFG